MGSSPEIATFVCKYHHWRTVRLPNACQWLSYRQASQFQVEQLCFNVLMPIYNNVCKWILCSFIIYLSSSKWQSLSAVLTLSSNELCSSLSPSVSVSPMSRLPPVSASWPFLDTRKMFTTCSRPQYDHRQAFTDIVRLKLSLKSVHNFHGFKLLTWMVW